MIRRDSKKHGMGSVTKESRKSITRRTRNTENKEKRDFQSEEGLEGVPEVESTKRKNTSAIAASSDTLKDPDQPFISSDPQLNSKGIKAF